LRLVNLEHRYSGARLFKDLKTNNAFEIGVVGLDHPTLAFPISYWHRRQSWKRSTPALHGFEVFEVC
jgi:hypothetical protein